MGQPGVPPPSPEGRTMRGSPAVLARRRDCAGDTYSRSISAAAGLYQNPCQAVRRARPDRFKPSVRDAWAENNLRNYDLDHCTEPARGLK